MNSKINLDCLSENTAPEAIELLLANRNKIDWSELSGNPEAIETLLVNQDQIDFDYLSRNTAPRAIELLRENLDKLKGWYWVSGNKAPEAIELLLENEDKIDWHHLSSNPGAIELLLENQDRIDALLNDLGLNGERSKKGDNLARKVFLELAQSHNAITMLALADRFDETRSRVQRTLERMREIGIIERVAMPERIAQDVFTGLYRQYDARGEEWLMTRGGVGRLPQNTSDKLILGVKKKNLNIEKVERILAEVPLDGQKLLLNTLGGRMPYGFRIAGKNGAEMSEKIINRCDRMFRRLRTVAKRLDDSLV